MLNKEIFMKIVGLSIKEVRIMTKEEVEIEGWEDWTEIPMVIILSNGSKIYPSKDIEGNGPGWLFGIAENGKKVFIEEGIV